MKINWGTGIVIAFGLFMIFILFFVYKVQTDSKYDNELVTKDYYKAEGAVNYDNEKRDNANALNTKVTIKKNDQGIQVEFPADFDYSKIEGKVSLYRPSSQKLDFEFKIELSSTHLLIPESSLTGGIWDVSVDWKYDGKDYLNKETVYF
ncbi:FixH family protein [Flavobacterium ardleyense]|uniref:FixH family protein n=1 Tax=Flavobacterium ardleyense TaxID=2038737 RepID=A0ABW5Z782_9FLAO